MDDTLIKVQDLSFKFPNQDKWFFNNLNFAIKANSKVVIYGKNGSGKSTLGKLLVGLYLFICSLKRVALELQQSETILNLSG